MPSDSPASARLAVLIDADNAQAAVIEDLLAEVSRYGIAFIRRAYGDWTTPNLGGWNPRCWITRSSRSSSSATPSARMRPTAR